MKRRITFVQRPEAPFEPRQAVLTGSTLSIRDLDAAREDRMTFGLDNLPEELRTVLAQSHELRLRWASEQSFDAIAPFASRVSPGLHVHYTPLVADQSSETLCSLLRAVFGADEDGRAVVDCLEPEETFTTPPLLSARFASSASLQFYTRLPSLQSLVAFIRRTACHQQTSGSECHDRADSLLTADSVDIDYDNGTYSLTVTGFWASGPSGGWLEEISRPASDADQVEFGLLGAEQGTNPEEIKVGGLLAVVGSDKKLKPTMFSFPSRHHTLPQSASYGFSFSKPTGLHPTMSITIPPSTLEQPPSASSDATCALHAYLTLPSTVFGDQYQLATTDPLFLQSHNLVALRAFSGETDLEAPDWVVQKWGSNLLFELATPTEDARDPKSNWTSTIPLHLRYLKPSESGYRSAHVPWPVVFWACTTEDDTEMGLNPFDRSSLGWDGLFGPRTTFYQLHPQSERLVEDLEVPVLELKDKGLFQARNIELITSVVISLGFLWVLWRLFKVAWSSGGNPDGRSKESRRHDKKD